MAILILIAILKSVLKLQSSQFTVLALYMKKVWEAGIFNSNDHQS